jgi:hypothetical protein
MCLPPEASVTVLAPHFGIEHDHGHSRRLLYGLPSQSALAAVDAGSI